MNKLETTIVGQARDHLSAVLDFYTAQQTGADSELHENDYMGDHGALCALLNLTQLDDSGLSVEAVGALRDIEAEHLASVPSFNSNACTPESPALNVAVRWQDGLVGIVDMSKTESVRILGDVAPLSVDASDAANQDARSLGFSVVTATQENSVTGKQEN